MNTVEIVEDIVRPIADEKGFRVVDIEYVKEGKNWFLRIYIDKPGGVDLNDCAMFNELVSEQMDALEPDPIPYAYYLEVSSPGAERPLKTEDDFEEAVGRYIHVTLFEPVEKNNVYDGTLKDLTKEKMVLTVKEKNKTKEIELKRTNISKARLAIEF
ncbi:ribosome maturation factor RimP [Atopostipes suicloacalis DSM 15692]|uniref:Ribosome maturation factor RimP n=1 Tax=Atopostipes suicloacalis DSM 15692 TaxID=1121025 RepID=A0A1M4TGR9_9LACT|nr:ribosome maturation factor RimP [Atopostipes suicloacalis]SHE43670.1 ribosome maturation factor RimP [Atopostipes suicloacalis DSM 15692]